MNLNFFEDIKKKVIGVDEVGRGALCGPVVSSAVLLNKNVLNHDLSKEIDDSKKLNAKKRYLLSNFIKKTLSLHLEFLQTLKLMKLIFLMPQFYL